MCLVACPSASVSKCVWARGAAPCGRCPARPCPSCCVLCCIGLALKSKGFNVRTGRGSKGCLSCCFLHCLHGNRKGSTRCRAGSPRGSGSNVSCYLPFCIGLASVSKCAWARGAAPCGRCPARPCLSCCFLYCFCLLYTSPSPRDQRGSRMPSSA